MEKAAALLVRSTRRVRTRMTASPISSAMSSGRVPGSMAARTMTTAPVTSAAACKARWNPRQ